MGKERVDVFKVAKDLPQVLKEHKLIDFQHDLLILLLLRFFVVERGCPLELPHGQGRGLHFVVVEVVKEAIQFGYDTVEVLKLIHLPVFLLELIPKPLIVQHDTCLYLLQLCLELPLLCDLRQLTPDI